MENKENKSSSRSASKAELNESTVPLLDTSLVDSDLTGEGLKKSKENVDGLELKERSSGGSVGGDEKDDSRTEKMDGEQGNAIDEEKAKKKKKEHRRRPSCGRAFTIGLNLLDRDEKRVNDHVNLQFEDVLAEPDGVHSFDGVWRTSYATFVGARVWLYRLLAAVIALPCAILWGATFALLSLAHVWAITPLLRVLDLFFFFVKRVWSSIVHTLCDPIFESCGMLFTNIRLHQRREEMMVA